MKAKKTTKQSYKLLDGVKQNKKFPTTFEIPTEQEKKELKPGMYTKLVFESIKKPQTRIFSERMWVKVTKVSKTGLVGTLANDPIILPNLKFEDTIKFELNNIVSIAKK